MSHLPEDLLYIFLSRLSVKSLLRFRCVSKLWLNLIDSPCFINIHLNNTKENSNNFMFVSSERNSTSGHTISMYAFDFDIQNNTTGEARKLEPPMLYDLSNVYICNGLICLHTFDMIFIWNPATHKLRKIGEKNLKYYFDFGFGYDDKTDDYKAVMLEKSFDQGRKCANVHVYSLKSGLWRHIGTLDGNGGLHRSVYVNGAIHWMDSYIVTEEPLKLKHGIVTFDLTTEKWIMPPPIPAEPTNDEECSLLDSWSLINHYGSLCASYYHHKTNIVDLWVMKGEGMKISSWSKLVTIKGINGELPTRITPVWSLKKTSRRQVLLNNLMKMELYDNEKGTKEDFLFFGVSQAQRSLIAKARSFAYYESLVLI